MLSGKESNQGADQRLRLERWFTAILLLAALNTAYLSWRFAALHAGWVDPGTGFCTWSDSVDCDKVLQSPEARAFGVPNAILGFGFFSGSLIWWLVGCRLGALYRHHVIRTLAFWLGVAAFMTFWFWRLLLGLEAFCPLCPWNHVLTYVALYLAVRLWRLTPRPAQQGAWGPLVWLVALCVVWFWACQGAWFAAEATILR